MNQKYALNAALVTLLKPVLQETWDRVGSDHTILCNGNAVVIAIDETQSTLLNDVITTIGYTELVDYLVEELTLVY